MTGKAKRFLLIHDQSLDIAGMRSMAGKAFVVLERSVLVLITFLFHERRMTPLAELVALCRKEIFIGSAMAAVAGRTTPLLYGVMNIVLLIFTFLGQMA